MKKIKCVLFDLDGTLFDTSEGIKMSYIHGLNHFGIYVNDASELDKVIGPSLYDSYHEFFGLNGEDLMEAVRLYREIYSSDGINMLRIYGGIEDMLTEIKRSGNKIGLATTKPLVMARKILETSGLIKYFDVVCGSNLDGSMSDKCDLINKCMEKSGFDDRDRVYMVGDRFYDIAGARKAGVHSIGVTYGFGSREELEKEGAEFIADSAFDITRMITS